MSFYSITKEQYILILTFEILSSLYSDKTNDIIDVTEHCPGSCLLHGLFTNDFLLYPWTNVVWPSHLSKWSKPLGTSTGVDRIPADPQTETEKLGSRSGGQAITIGKRTDSKNRRRHSTTISLLWPKTLRNVKYFVSET